MLGLGRRHEILEAPRVWIQILDPDNFCYAETIEGISNSLDVSFRFIENSSHLLKTKFNNTVQ